MISVEQRIKQITQPKGGYLSSQQFHMIALENRHALHACENISKKLIGLADNCFKISGEILISA